MYFKKHESQTYSKPGKKQGAGGHRSSRMAVKDGKQGRKRVPTYGELVRNWREKKIIKAMMQEHNDGRTGRKD